MVSVVARNPRGRELFFDEGESGGGVHMERGHSCPHECVARTTFRVLWPRADRSVRAPSDPQRHDDVLVIVGGVAGNADLRSGVRVFELE